MKKVVKRTVVSLGLVVAMVSCTKEEVVEQYPITDAIPTKKEIPVIDNKQLPLPFPILEEEHPRKKTNDGVRELQRETEFERTPQELKEQENEFRARPIQKSVDMGIMREMPELQKVVVMVND